ncbi:MAG: nuclear transport factor 2 family protein [Mucilaginibacter sp.]|nr:nuclear transport factor 2 family protein [Mucilaginibacter sp.]
MELSKESQQTQEVLNGFFQGTSQNDVEAIAKYIAEDVDFYIAESPYMPWTGKKNGKKEVITALQQIIEAHNTAEDDFEMDHTFIDGTEAAVFGKAGRTVKATGKKFKEPFVMRFTITNGHITRLLMLEDSHQIEKAFKEDKSQSY